ncbi:DNA-binding winged helix-turn-helix (wHTH) protein [Chitinophaga terrae (ex Kim and Jung 2007)]|uniref:helix-turn-helix domain-containing protein n=1 Tax=Chitinophaga terrae (ex Kim and Jung 2007) TaxID=408074 RepID=UPI002784892D|nr:helix-turn-helix domain-containing protein [Chitinophaga terrae (ex Kim and Jung 2007)]MDQ0105331.1 DNA-binding winged helix-turn-helix (wHTH) protein [Chitinophaga terrae (ex Kim and Jung 2007)]
MSDSRNPLSGKRRYLFGLLLLLFISAICVAFTIRDNDGFDTSRREVLLRRIGHELLLQSGDSTSRVLPVEKLSDNEYQVRFEKEFTFQPDSLVSTTQRLLAKDPFASDYVVNVLNCANASVAYEYAISKNKKDNIITCLGRRQPVACYIIDIKFKPRGITTTKNKYLLGGGLLCLAIAGFVFFRPVKPRRALPVDDQQMDMITLGAVLFDTKNRKLVIDGTTTDLTGTETRVLSIFAKSQNEIIERSRLQKEIWEDEGVIVGRSLDMFISKLRKKLEPDPNIKIVAIRGKGYKLEISS